MKGPHCIYHWSGEMKVVETEEYMKKLLQTKEWFDSPKKAWEYKYLYKIIMWTKRQACFLLVGQNPGLINKQWPKEARSIEEQLNQDYLLNKIKLTKKEDTRGKIKFIGSNKDFITWAIQKNLPQSETFLKFLNNCEIKEINATDTERGNKDSVSLSNNPINSIEKTGEEIKKIWVRVEGELCLMARGKKNGNKIEYARRGINLVLDAIKEIIPNFNPMEMPDNVDSFHKFCLAIPCGDKIFPLNKKTFNRYCRGVTSKKLLPALCGWFNPPKLRENFWSNIYPDAGKPYSVVKFNR